MTATRVTGLARELEGGLARRSRTDDDEVEGVAGRVGHRAVSLGRASSAAVKAAITSSPRSTKMMSEIAVARV